MALVSLGFRVVGFSFGVRCRFSSFEPAYCEDPLNVFDGNSRMDHRMIWVSRSTKRNALGSRVPAMGFAVIPTIFSITERRGSFSVRKRLNPKFFGIGCYLLAKP